MVEVTIIGTSGIFTVKQWAKTLSMRVFNSVDVLGLLWTPLRVKLVPNKVLVEAQVVKPFQAFAIWFLKWLTLLKTVVFFYKNLTRFFWICLIKKLLFFYIIEILLGTKRLLNWILSNACLQFRPLGPIIPLQNFRKRSFYLV